MSQAKITSRFSDAQTRSTMIMNHFRAATRTAVEYAKYVVDEKDINTWYVLLHNFDGDDGEFAGGEYLVRISIAEETRYPYGPPKFWFMTDNGVFTPEAICCISIGGYHPDNYPATLRVNGFADQLKNVMIQWRTIGSGINLIKSSAKVKRRLAKASRAANWRKHPKIMSAITASFEQYSAKWDFSKIPGPMLVRLKLVAPTTADEESAESVAELVAQLRIETEAANAEIEAAATGKDEVDEE